MTILVTEPTPFGLHDLVLAVEMARKLEVPFAVIINRSDVGDGKVIEYCRKENIPVLMEIPNSLKVAQNYSRGIPLIRALPEYTDRFNALWNDIQERVAS